MRRGRWSTSPLMIPGGSRLASKPATRWSIHFWIPLHPDPASYWGKCSCGHGAIPLISKETWRSHVDGVMEG